MARENSPAVIGGDPSRAAGRLSGKRAIVTGAGSGIGRAASRLFAAEGAAVLVVDCVAESVEQTAAMIREAGGRAVAVAADAGSERDVQAVVARAAAELGGLDVVYANAGVSGGDVPLAEQTVELWQNVLRVNLIGPFLLAKHAGARMVAQGHGSIVCTASVAGLRANAGGNPYSASKAGVISLVQTCANSFWGTGVRINAICPGLIETGLTADIVEAAELAAAEDDGIPIGRVGEPEDIANACAWLCHEASGYVTGQTIGVNGGRVVT
ncbi:MAG TPA: SDR family NAD(P)-dependent oxidoreductase [Burkholderiaceae bacterium]|nr:SDR family NAD(P)-dependent oxidoreductase [Burkholderiaceae bacterium]